MEKKIVLSNYDYGTLTDGVVSQSFQFTQLWTSLIISFQSIIGGNDNANTYCSFANRRILLNETIQINPGGDGICTESYPVIVKGNSVLLQITTIYKL
jgi:hypothetical protein